MPLLPRFCLLIVLLLWGCSDSGKTIIPEKFDPPPTQTEGTLAPSAATPNEKTGK